MNNFMDDKSQSDEYNEDDKYEKLQEVPVQEQDIFGDKAEKRHGRRHFINLEKVGDQVGNLF